MPPGSVACRIQTESCASFQKRTVSPAYVGGVVEAREVACQHLEEPVAVVVQAAGLGSTFEKRPS